MKRQGCIVISVILLLALFLGSAGAESTDILGRPFPDFSVTDTEGNTFTLSERLRDHEAALINIWATWCPPCKAEMPFLNEIYQAYGDRVAFIALSYDPDDTMEKIEAYRQDLGLLFPMGRDEDAALFQYLGFQAVPTTAIVDRFGNTVFFRVGSFFSQDQIKRCLEAFLGDGYTETAPLKDIPKDVSTNVFPVSSVRDIHVENENAKKVLYWAAGDPEPWVVYVVEDEAAHLRLDISPSDDPASLLYYNYSDIIVVQDLLDAERNAFVFDQPLPDAETGEYYAFASLTYEKADPNAIGVYLLPGEQYIETLAQDMRDSGYDVTWEYSEDAQPEAAQKQAYLVHVADQDGLAVPGVMVNFCTDTACMPMQSDENGLITFSGAPDVYHIQLLRAPDGYSFDPAFEFYTDASYGEWVLRIQKN